MVRARWTVRCLTRINLHADLAQKHQQCVLEVESRGAFGVPTFCYGDELYWGNDKLVLLEAALEAV